MRDPRLHAAVAELDETSTRWEAVRMALGNAEEPRSLISRDGSNLAGQIAQCRSRQRLDANCQGREVRWSGRVVAGAWLAPFLAWPAR